jgi:hypothetical protein
MKNGLIILTLLISFSCGQEKTNRDGKAQQLDQKPIKTEELKTEEIKVEEQKPIGTGKITTIADGYDVKRVNLFSSTSSNRTINCYLKKEDKVNILEDADPYYLVEQVSSKGCKGYCMKDSLFRKSECTRPLHS